MWLKTVRKVFKMNGKSKAFTLIELLTIIAIVAILAAFIFPVLARAKLRAGQAACTSNLKQLGASVYLYAADHDDHTPITKFPQDIVPALKPYTRLAEVFKCPNDHEKREPTGNLAGGASNYAVLGTSYLFIFNGKSLSALSKVFPDWTMATDTFNAHTGDNWQLQSPELWMVNTLAGDLSVRHQRSRAATAKYPIGNF